MNKDIIEDFSYIQDPREELTLKSDEFEVTSMLSDSQIQEASLKARDLFLKMTNNKNEEMQ